MSSQEVVTSLENGVRILRINRPKTKNAFNSAVYTILANTLNEDANNDNVIVTILTGTGDYYSSGFDIKSAMSEFGSDKQRGMSELKRMIHAFIVYPKLLISLVNGPAIGIAVTTAALCDIVYASDRATFETPFIKLGLCAEGGASFTFPYIMGRSKGSEVLLLGKQISAQEAYQFGFVAEVVPHDKFNAFMDELKQLGKKLPLSSVKGSKKLILKNLEHVLIESMERELEQLEECFLSDEFAEGIVRFMSRKSKL